MTPTTGLWALRQLTTRVQHCFKQLCELEERQDLLLRPWEEEFFHWAQDQHGTAHLHGRVVPPARRRSSVTAAGWCPGLRNHSGSRAPCPERPEDG